MLFGLLQGTLDILVLQALAQGTNHGYGVARWIHERPTTRWSIEDGALVHGAPSPREERTPPGGVGTLRVQSPREVLLASPPRADACCASRPTPGIGLPGRSSKCSGRSRERPRHDALALACRATTRRAAAPSGRSTTSWRFTSARATAELEARGMSRSDARRTIERRFGSMQVHRRNLLRLELQADARIRRRAIVEVWRVGTRSFVRGVLATPGFAAAVIAILSLGLGVNAVAFRLVDRPGAERAGRARRHPIGCIASSFTIAKRMAPRSPTRTTPISTTAIFLSVGALSGAAGETSAPQLLGSGSSAERIRARLVTAGYFSLLGVATGDRTLLHRRRERA